MDLKKLTDEKWLNLYSANNWVFTSRKDLTEENEAFHPARRENDTLNNSIRKIVGNLNDSNTEVLISEMGKENLE